MSLGEVCPWQKTHQRPLHAFFLAFSKKATFVSSDEGETVRRTTMEAGKGLCVLTENDITDMNRYLLRKEASFSRLRLSNFINANREYTIKATGWFFHRDEQGIITGKKSFHQLQPNEFAQHLYVSIILKE